MQQMAETDGLAADFWDCDAGFRAVLEAAERRGIPVRPLGALGIAVLGEGSHEVLLNGGITGRTSHLAVRLAGNKAATKTLLARAGIPVPAGQEFAEMVEGRAYMHALGRAVVVKPVFGNLGRGVCTAIRDEAAFVSAWREAVHVSRRVMVEAMEEGRDLRVLVAGDKVLAAAERVPPAVTGNGRDTVAALIAAFNDAPERGASHEQPATRVPLDVELAHTIAQQGHRIDTVVDQGQRLVLRRAANLSRGARAIDRTDALHPDNAALAIGAARATGLDIAGVDMLVRDAGRSWHQGGVHVLEVNATPGLRAHLFPAEGPIRHVDELLLDYLFPPPLQSLPSMPDTRSRRPIE